MAERKAITEEMKLHKEWYAQAETITMDDLMPFIQHLTNDYTHDYGTICHAITAAGLAAMKAVNRSGQGGISGFQAGAVMWEFITQWMPQYKNKPIRLTDYEKMLYPQYVGDFISISEETAEWLKKEAQDRIKTNDEKTVSKEVYDHWTKVAEGYIPFGYRVKGRRDE